MLIQITNFCPCNCSHCFVDANLEGNHMEDKVFINCIQFAIDNEIKVINISGGEPVLHPKFFKFIAYALSKIRGKKIVLAIESSGVWMLDDDRRESYIRQLRKILDNPQIGWMQISTNEKYYPNYKEISELEQVFKQIHSKVHFEKNWQGVDTNLQYMGRARNFMKDEDIVGIPTCLNWIQYALSMKLQGKFSGNLLRQISDFAIYKRSKSCIPAIDVNGNIRITEGNMCKPLGNIMSYFPAKKREFAQQLFDSIINYKVCDKCKAVKNIPENAKLSINKMCELNNVEPKFK